MRRGRLHSLAVLKLFSVTAYLTFCAYGKEPPPSWLDTRPPAVKIDPADRFHGSVFHVTLFSDETSEIWVSRQRPDRMERYRRPLPVTSDGIHRFYYYGEDDFGNRSEVDSMEYVLDTRPAQLTVSPASGMYRPGQIITLRSNEPCRFLFMAGHGDTAGIPISDTIVISRELDGYFTAVDSAGNRTVSERFRYTVDTARLSAVISPPGGIYRVAQRVTLDVPSGTQAFYTFDPLAPPEWFVRYMEPLKLPHGLTIVRYFVRSESGTTSPIGKMSYIIDTIAPKINCDIHEGDNSDTVFLSCRERVVIRYTDDGSVPDESSPEYTVPIVTPHEGISRIKARAWDRAGNVSAIFTRDRKFDYTPPVVKATPPGGSFRSPVNVTLLSNEPARMLYSINGKGVDKGALVYSPEGISITREGETVLRFMGVDAADNQSEEMVERYLLDSRPPDIHASIQGSISADLFYVSLVCDEPASLYYTINGESPTERSAPYRGPVSLKSGDVLRYFGVDSIGNATSVTVLDDLDKPMVEAKPGAGLFNRILRIEFEKNVPGTVWWRLLPDTLFRSQPDTVMLDREGAHTMEYFIRSKDGAQSFILRNEYVLDWTPPRVNVRVKKGIADSAAIFFETQENASIYYTVDGTNPLVSSTVKTAGNRFQRSNDRIAVRRTPGARLAFYAEDAAGNQSAMELVDVFNPKVIPNVPAGFDRLYDRILSIVLMSQEGSAIHYERHGKKPTKQSPVFRAAITLSSSDTISAFAIDASGYQGEVEEFIYRIDLPPSPQFSVIPDTIHAGTRVTLDASATFDRETLPQFLRFQWDFNDDGVFDTDTSPVLRVNHTFKNAAVAAVVLRTIDQNGRSAQLRRKITVLERCPSNMAPSFDLHGKAFCIDRYEWPNRKGVEPIVGVSWVEAKMFCIDAGKRLCSADEWLAACRNNSATLYPYGERYDPQRCVTEGKGVAPSGSKSGCQAGGVSDMVGNSWEWIEDKQGDYVRAYGGSFHYGKDAHCGLIFDGTVATSSNETGFRCCR